MEGPVTMSVRPTSLKNHNHHRPHHRHQIHLGPSPCSLGQTITVKSPLLLHQQENPNNATTTTTTTIINTGNAEESANSITCYSHSSSDDTVKRTYNSPGATVFIEGNNNNKIGDDVVDSRHPDVQTRNIASSPCFSSDDFYRNQAAPANAAHVVKIKINSSDDNAKVISAVRLNVDGNLREFNTTDVRSYDSYPSLIINNINEKNDNYRDNDDDDEDDEIDHLNGVNGATTANVNNSATSSSPSSSCFYYNNSASMAEMSSGQCSPSETLDSGTCSDLENSPPPPTSKLQQKNKIFSQNEKGCQHQSNNKILNKRHHSQQQHHQQRRHDRTGSLTSSGAEIDSDDNESSVSCDSLNNGSRPSCVIEDLGSIRKTNVVASSSSPKIRSPIITECTYEERSKLRSKSVKKEVIHVADNYYNFHINEKPCKDDKDSVETSLSGKDENGEENDESFAGYKILEREAIRSAKGTVRGVKNRVRAGIATFLQTDKSKNYKAKDAGKVVVYTTTMGVVRETHYRCILVKQILRTHMVKFEERDMYLSSESQNELKERLNLSAIHVPQLFIDGQYIGDAETVERLNESGELRLMLKPYKSLDACQTCQACGGYRLLPCPICYGSKKSVHRNNFTVEFTALKCMHCNEVGLVKCPHC